MEIHANTSLIAEGVVDSMTIIQLILYVENKYHVNFNEDDMLFDEMTNPLGFAGITFEKIGKV